MGVLLVRHAHAGERGKWRGDDAKRPLDKRGRLQADALIPIVRRYEPVRVLSSPAVRCVETVEPVAESLGLVVERVDDLAEGNSKEAIRMVKGLAKKAWVVLCSHGDVVPDVLDALTADGLEGWREVERCQKGSVWVVESKGGRFTKATYVPTVG